MDKDIAEGMLNDSLDKTELMRFHQDQITRVGSNRRRLWYELWNEGFYTQKELAAKCGVTRGVVYKEIKRWKEEAGL